MKRVSGKVAIVTGGARGLGAAFVRRLAEEGADVVVTDVLDAEGEKLASSLGSNVRFEHHDVTSESQWQHIVAVTEQAFGPVTILINNAGISHSDAIETYEESDFRRVMDVNVIGVFLGMKSVVRSMRQAGGGAMINISSTSGLRGVTKCVAYTASKFAVRGMTKAAAVEFAPYSIRVNSIHPGPTRTPMILDGAGMDIIESVVAQVPAKRIGETEEFANMMLLLASDEATFATGAEFVMDGGLTCR